MEHHDQPANPPADETVIAYDPPLVEDLDTSHGPLVTAAGIGTVTGSTTTTTNSAAAPREI